MIEWLLDWFARPEDRRNRGLMDGLISGSGTEDEARGIQHRTMEGSTSRMGDYDE